MWGCIFIYPVTANDSIFRAFSNFVRAAPSDPDAALIVAPAYAQGSYILSNNYEYCEAGG